MITKGTIATIGRTQKGISIGTEILISLELNDRIETIAKIKYKLTNKSKIGIKDEEGKILLATANRIIAIIGPAIKYTLL